MTLEQLLQFKDIHVRRVPVKSSPHVSLVVFHSNSYESLVDTGSNSSESSSKSMYGEFKFDKLATNGVS
jgi:hypothetical protein